MIPQQLPANAIGQDWLKIILLHVRMPCKLLSQNIIFTGNKFWWHVRPHLHSSKKVNIRVVMRRAIDVDAIWGFWHASRTLLKVNWLFQVIAKWNGATATGERCGCTRSSSRARYRRRGQSPTPLLWWSWSIKWASNGRDGARYIIPWNVDFTGD